MDFVFRAPLQLYLLVKRQLGGRPELSVGVDVSTFDEWMRDQWKLYEAQSSAFKPSQGFSADSMDGMSL